MQNKLKIGILLLLIFLIGCSGQEITFNKTFNKEYSFSSRTCNFGHIEPFTGNNQTMNFTLSPQSSGYNIGIILKYNRPSLTFSRINVELISPSGKKYYHVEDLRSSKSSSFWGTYTYFSIKNVEQEEGNFILNVRGDKVIIDKIKLRIKQ